MRPARAATLLALSAALAWTRDAQAKKDAEEFRFELAVERLEVEVLVHNSEGRFVTDLAPEDFEVFEEGKKVKILEFELRGLSSGDPELSMQAGRAATPPVAGRKFIVFVDLLNTGIGAISTAKPALQAFVKDVLVEGDQIMVCGVTPDHKGIIVQDFTSSRASMLRAIDALHGNSEVDDRDERQEREIYNLLYREKRATNTQAQLAMVLQQMFADIRVAGSAAKDYSRQELQRTAFALDAVASLVEYVDQSGQEKGRKPVLFLSERIPVRPAQRLYDIVNRRIDEYNAIVQAPNSIQLPSRLFHEEVDQDLQKVLRATSGRLGRFGATIYGIDVRDRLSEIGADASTSSDQPPAAAHTEARFEGQQGLGALSADTGGVAYLRRADLDGVLREVEQDNRTRYFLTYKPPKHKKQSTKFYQIEVRCKRPGLTVRARKGYLD